MNGCDQISEENFPDLFNGNMQEGMLGFGIPKEKMPDILNSLKTGLLGAQNEIFLFDGIDSMLEQLSAENEIIIITSNVSEVVENFLKSKNINCYKDIIGGEKEASKVLKIEAIKIKYPNHNYFYIGDTKGDIIEGKKAGVKTVAVTWGWHSESLLLKEHPNHIAHSPEELVELFKSLVL